MTKYKEIEVKYLPTGIIFHIPEPDLLEVLKKDRGNFEVLDKDFNIPKQEVVLETTTYEQVVDEEPEEQNITSRQEELNKMKVAALVAYCNEKGIAYASQDRKADLIAKIIAAETTTEAAEEQIAE